MTGQFQLLFLIFSISLLALVLELTRRRHIRGKYTLIWLFTCFVFFFVGLVSESLPVVARLLGIVTPAYAVFIVAILCIVFLLIEFSAIATSLHFHNRELIKKVSLLAWRVEQLEQEKRP